MKRLYLLIAAAMTPLLIYLIVVIWYTARGHPLFPGQPAIILGTGAVLAIASAALANFIRVRSDRNSGKFKC